MRESCQTPPALQTETRLLQPLRAKTRYPQEKGKRTRSAKPWGGTSSHRGGLLGPET